MLAVKSIGARLAVPLLILTASGLAWQQDVRYDIRVKLDTKASELVGTERLWYRNNSPDTLDSVWVHLYPNAYRSRGTTFGRELEEMRQYNFSFAQQKDRGGIDVTSLVVRSGGESLRSDAQVLVGSDSTEVMVALPHPLLPWDTAVLDFEFRVKVPAFFSRLGHKGKHYVISQWYPKMVVYDEKGWHPDGYHAIGEFYGEFGAFDVEVTVPAEMVVGATGDLVECGVQNAECRTQDADSVAGQSAAVDSELGWMRVEPKLRVKRAGDKTLRFRAENVHDFAWVADPGFRLIQDSFQQTTINVLVRKDEEKDWKSVPGWARRTLEQFTVNYGPYPYRQLTVADARLAAGGGMEYPNLVVISTQAIPGIRMLEMTVMHEIGHQWFYGMLGSDEQAEAWLDEGMTTFAEQRYFEENYGPDGNLSDYPAVLIPQISDRYFGRVVYQLAATSGMLKPLLTPACRYSSEPVAYQAQAYEQGAFVMQMLRAQLGRELFDLVMKEYFRRFQFRHPTSEDFIQVVNDLTGQDWHWFFDQWLRTDKSCDYALGSVKRRPDGVGVEVRRNGGIVMPVDIRAEFRDGTSQTLVWFSESTRTRVEFLNRSGLRGVSIDPDEKLLETSRWNNHYPYRFEHRILFGLPSFDAYQLFYGPYLWYDATNGLQLGLWMQGREFVDYGPAHGRHMWTLSSTYSTGINQLVTGGSYSTPLSFISDRLKFGASASYSQVYENAGASLTLNLGRVLGSPSGMARIGYRYDWLKNTLGWHPQDWDTARAGRFEAQFGWSHIARMVQGDERLNLAWASPRLGGLASFAKASIESRSTFRLSRDLRVRLRAFVGATSGNPPAQEQFFLSGKLGASESEPITWTYTNTTFSTQNNWHVDGDANLRGYITEHQRGRLVAALNLSLPFQYVEPFFDIGNVGDTLGSFAPGSLRMDAGVRLKLGPLYADLPIWANRPAKGRQLDFRWALGLTLSGISIGI
jgi:hypothetical protein